MTELNTSEGTTGEQVKELAESGGAQAIRESLEYIVNFAAAVGFVVTVSQKPLEPLAMGRYESVVEIRKARELAEPIIRYDIEQKLINASYVSIDS